MKNRQKINIPNTGICILLLSTLLSSCGNSNQQAAQHEANNTGDADTSVAETELVIINPLDELESIDCNGKTFRVMGRVNEAYGSSYNSLEIYAESEDGEPLNDAVFRRNMLLSERYNVNFSQTLCESGKELSTLATLCASGEDQYDLVFIPMQNVGTAAKNGYLYDMNAIEDIHFDKPYWNQDVNKVLTINGKLYFTSSDYSLLDKARTNIFVYNNSMSDSYSIPNIVDTVNDGKWTVEKMKEYCEVVANDLNGDGIMDQEDRFGLGMDSLHAFNAFVIGCNNEFVKNSRNSLEIVSDFQHISDTVDLLIPVLCDKSLSFFCEDFNNYSAVAQMFNAGKSLFRIAQPISLSGLSANCDFQYTIIPLPKYDEFQEKYLTTADPESMLFGIPVTTSAPEFSGFILQALSAASTDTSLKAYYETRCKTKYVSNEESAIMLDLIFDGISYDLSAIYNIGLSDIMRNIASKGQNLFSSEFAKKESAAQKAIDELMTAFHELSY